MAVKCTDSHAKCMLVISVGLRVLHQFALTSIKQISILTHHRGVACTRDVLHMQMHNDEAKIQMFKILNYSFWGKMSCKIYDQLAGVPGVARVNKEIMIHFVYPFS